VFITPLFSDGRKRSSKNRMRHALKDMATGFTVSIFSDRHHGTAQPSPCSPILAVSLPQKPGDHNLPSRRATTIFAPINSELWQGIESVSAVNNHGGRSAYGRYEKAATGARSAFSIDGQHFCQCTELSSGDPTALNRQGFQNDQEMPQLRQNLPVCDRKVTIQASQCVEKSAFTATRRPVSEVVADGPLPSSQNVP